MPAAVRSSFTLTSTGASPSIHCGVPDTPAGPSYASLHAWHIRNNHSSDATVRPQGSLVDDYNDVPGSQASLWFDLDSEATVVGDGETELIILADVPLVRTRLNVSVLGGGSLDVQYLGVTS